MRVASNHILFLLLMSVLVGCSAPKGLVKGNGISSSEVAVFSALPSFNRDAGYLSANVRMTATVNGESASTKGKLRIRRGEGVQVSATAMGLMEAACFEFLPDVVRFIYKIDKIYAESPYRDVSFLQGTGTDYTVLESLLMNAVFSQDGRPVREDLPGMSCVDTGGYMTLMTSGRGRSVYSFTFEKNSGNLVRCEGKYADGGLFVCRYSDFVAVDGVPYPSVVELEFDGEGNEASLLFKMSGIKSSEFKFSPRRVSAAYERVSLEGLLDSVGESVE